MYNKKYTGCLLGSAVGDALGMQTEGMTPAEIIQKFNVVFDYGPGRRGSPNEKLRPGQYTDDTEQTLILARSIIKARTFDPALFSKMLVEHCEKILTNPDLNRGWGSTTLGACQRLLSGIPWKESGGDIPTCGSAIRVSPVGLLYPGKHAGLEDCAFTSSLPTHNSAESIAGAVAVAAAVSLAVVNTNPGEIIRKTADIARKYDMGLANKIYSIEKMSFMTELNAFSILGTSIRTADVVPSALYCFARNPLDFPKAIIMAVNAGGDTDSIAAIAGAVSGAYLGVEAIPKKWLDGLEKRDEIESVALDLWKIGRHNI